MIEALAADDDAEAMVFALAPLPRGALPMQAYSAEEERFLLLVAKTADDGLAVLREIELTPGVVARAAELGVAIEHDPDDDLERAPPDLRILAGEPDAVLDLMGAAVEARFDRGVRHPGPVGRAHERLGALRPR